METARRRAEGGKTETGRAEERAAERGEKGSPGDFSGNSGDGPGRWTIYYVTSRGK